MNKQLNICNNIVEIITGCNSKIASIYVEATKRLHNDNDAAMKYLKKFLTSIDALSNSTKVKDNRISSSRGNVEALSNYKDIETAMSFINRNLSGIPIMKDLSKIFSCLKSNKSQYMQGYAKKCSLVIMEYENAVYLLITGLVIVMANNMELVQNGKNIKFRKKSGSEFHVVVKTAADFAKIVSATNHGNYLTDVIKATSISAVNEKPEDGTKPINEATLYTEEGAIISVLSLIGSIFNNAKHVASFTKNTFITIKNTIFGIIPLIRSIIYMRYKHKADSIASLEQTVALIEQNIDILKNTKNDMSDAEKAEIIKKQRAYARMYQKKADKLKAQFIEMEKDVAKAIAENNDDVKKSGNDDDFVLEAAGFGAFNHSNSYIADRRDHMMRSHNHLMSIHAHHNPSMYMSNFRPMMIKQDLDQNAIRDIEAAVAELQEQTSKATIELKVNRHANEDNDPSDRTRSKFGGTPWWPTTMPWPKYKDKDMFLVAQINFNEFPNIPGYPQTGLLQFFCTDSVWYNAEKTAFKTVYHPSIDPNVQTLDNPPQSTCNMDNFAFDGVFFVEGRQVTTMGVCYMGDAFKNLINPILEKYGVNIADPGVFRCMGNIMKRYSGWGHRLGGWPNFTQWDVTDDHYNTLLLQIDSDNAIQWGDCGIANMFINDADLKALNFNDVLYTWDCY